MEAIKKKIAALKMEMDAANEKVETNEVKAKQENFRADMIYDEVRDLEKKLAQMEKDYTTIKNNLEESSAELDRCEKAYTKVPVFYLCNNIYACMCGKFVRKDIYQIFTLTLRTYVQKISYETDA